jgi:mannose-1-phosphate guanylyltransferase / mannose-6-phosphate isomerase
MRGALKRVEHYAIILCGGTGSRLWPWSTKACPKPYMPILDEETSLLQHTLKRALNLVERSHIWIVTHESQASLVRTQAKRINPTLVSRILTEKEARNTLPATAAALQKLPRQGTVTILPSDHLIRDQALFYEDWKKAIHLAHSEHFVLFGIPPRHPSSDFGYLEMEDSGQVQAFHEKPPLEIAEQYVKRGFLWNSGILVANLGLIQQRIKEKGPFKNLAPQSLDHGLLEGNTQTLAIRARFDWSDLGTWENLFEALPKQEAQNVLKGDVQLVESERNLVWARSAHVTLLGVDDLILVQNGDEILVSKRGPLKKATLETLRLQGEKKERPPS